MNSLCPDSTRYAEDCQWPSERGIDDFFDSFSEAKARTEELIKEFIEDFGEDIIEYATKADPVAVMYNGEVTAYAFIEEVKEKKK